MYISHSEALPKGAMARSEVAFALMVPFESAPAVPATARTNATAPTTNRERGFA